MYLLRSRQSLSTQHCYKGKIPNSVSLSLSPVNNTTKEMEILHTIEQEQRAPWGTSFLSTALYQTLCVCVCLQGTQVTQRNVVSHVTSNRSVLYQTPDLFLFHRLHTHTDTHTEYLVLYMSWGSTMESNLDVTLVFGPSVMMSLTISDVTDVQKDPVSFLLSTFHI